jgi:hypothetical protein
MADFKVGEKPSKHFWIMVVVSMLPRMKVCDV